MSRLKLVLAASLLSLAAAGQANAQRMGRVKASNAKPAKTVSKSSARPGAARTKAGAATKTKVLLRPSKSAALRTQALEKSVTARQLKNSALPSRIQRRVLKDIGTLTQKSVLDVKESQKTFGTQIVYQGSQSKFVKGQGRIHSPVEVKVLLSSPTEITVTRTWGKEVGSAGGQLVVGTNRGYGPKQREHQYSVSPTSKKGVLMEMSTTSQNGRIVDRRAYEVNAKTGKRIQELEKYRVN